MRHFSVNTLCMLQHLPLVSKVQQCCTFVCGADADSQAAAAAKLQHAACMEVLNYTRVYSDLQFSKPYMWFVCCVCAARRVMHHKAVQG
jgi:hypothetical protein